MSVTGVNGPIVQVRRARWGFVAINGRGEYAWQISGYQTAGGGHVDAVYAPDGRGGDVELDEGPLGSIRGLRVRGNTVSWTRSGKRRSAALPGSAVDLPRAGSDVLASLSRSTGACEPLDADSHPAAYSMTLGR